jgi:hypothetical protein
VVKVRPVERPIIERPVVARPLYKVEPMHGFRRPPIMTPQPNRPPNTAMMSRSFGRGSMVR